MIIIEDNFLKESELQGLENIIINAPSRQLDDTGNHVGSYTEYSWHIIDSELRTSPHRIPLLNKLSEVYVGKGIDDEVVAPNGKLDQANLFTIAVKAVGLDVQRDSFAILNPLDQPFQNARFANVDVVVQFWCSQ